MALVAESVLWLLPVTADGIPAGRPRRVTSEPADHPTWGRPGTLLHLSAGRLRLLDLADGSAPVRCRTLPVPLTNRAERRRERLRVHAGLLWDGTGSAPP